MATKALAIKEMDEKGVGLALIGILSDVDHDGDTYAKGAFDWVSGGQWAHIVPAHNWNHMPFGKARVYEEGDEALAELRLNMDTAVGRDWHSALSFDLKTGASVQQWSYGYDAEKYSHEMRAAQKVRVLERVKVFEVSPVIRGAAKRSETRGMKGVSLKEEDFAATMAELQEMAGAIEANPAMLSATGLKQLGDIHARIDAAVKAATPPGQDDGDGGLGNRIHAKFLYETIKRNLPAD